MRPAPTRVSIHIAQTLLRKVPRWRRSKFSTASSSKFTPMNAFEMTFCDMPAAAASRDIAGDRKSLKIAAALSRSSRRNASRACKQQRGVFGVLISWRHPCYRKTVAFTHQRGCAAERWRAAAAAARERTARNRSRPSLTCGRDRNRLAAQRGEHPGDHRLKLDRADSRSLRCSANSIKPRGAGQHPSTASRA